MKFFQPPGFQLGFMREVITVQEATETYPDGQVTRAWTDLYANEYASFEPATAGETVRGRQVEANIDAVFTVRKRNGYSVGNRIQFDNGYWNIVAVKQAAGGPEFLELHCQSVAP